jgi:hypothetical protein
LETLKLILELPAHDDLAALSLSQLHLAWDIAVDVLRRWAGSDVSEWDNEGEASDLYWTQVQPELANAYNLIQQSHEFAIKARIAGVSPYLLLSRDPRDWPRGCDKADLPFSVFRSVDAADLIRLHNTVQTPRLSEAFITFYHEIRRRRNVLIHHGLSDKKIDLSELFIAVLETHRSLFDGNWGVARSAYWTRGSIATLYTDKYTHDAVLSEFEAVVEFLKPSPLRRYFGFRKRSKRYICPHCRDEAREARWLGLAQLTEPEATSTALLCFVCGKTHQIVRVRCGASGCKGNVCTRQPSGSMECLTCGEEFAP